MTALQELLFELVLCSGLTTRVETQDRAILAWPVSSRVVIMQLLRTKSIAVGTPFRLGGLCKVLMRLIVIYHA